MSMASNSNQIDSSYYASSSSSSTPPPRWNVFLSFRGEDTRNNFTGHLYSALVRAGIRTFMDDPELPRGEEISTQLLKAIQESKVSIVVFSKNYASSRWCLDELVKILECKRTMGQLVLPVFYNVPPSVVRYKTNSFAEAFESHKKRFETNMEKVEKWEGALTEAANLSGYDLENDANGHETKLIQIIVQKVLLEVNLICLNVAKQPVGIESRVEYIAPLLSIGTNDIRRIGIYGMGGIGKTTIAKALFNENFRYFEGSCFLANVRETSEERNGILQLQGQLLSDILKVKIGVENVDKGIGLLKERLRSKKLLIVLDDVDHLSQSDQLAGQWNQFALGSRIIITTRDAGVLDQIEVEERHNVEELNDDESLELFSRHAFKKSVPSKHYMKISEGIVRQAGGLPLALEVLGSYLFKRTMIEWRSSLDKLRQIPRDEIQKKLIISYHGLGDGNLKDVFLDIACFFIGKDKETTIGILNSCGFNSENEIIILIERCLLSINDKNELRMHDLLRDMGREIVNKESPNESGKRSRIWSSEDISNVLEKQKGTEAIECIIPYYKEELPRVTLNTKTFERMHKLRLLDIDYVHLTGNFQHIFKELRWLSWKGCRLRCLPSDFHPEKLVILNLEYSKINILWHGILFLEQLKILDLGSCEFLTTTPNFTGVPNLEKLLLGCCVHLAEIHPSIGHLSRLACLCLSDCQRLRRIPNSICNLRALESLSVYLCSNLEELPEELGNIESLRELVASHSGIFKIPDSIGRLSRLVTLDLEHCFNLITLPNSLCNLRVLESLCLNDCYSLKGLPEELGNIESLRVLRAGHTAITKLPNSIGRLSKLFELNLFYCVDLRNIPSSICKLPLRKLHLGKCYLSDNYPFDGHLLDSIGSLSSLELLSLSANIFSTLPCNLSQLSNLKRLELQYCWSLRSLTKLPPNLEELDARECASMERLPNLSNLKHLRLLFLANCSRLVEIQGLDKLSSIQQIHLEGCTNLAITFKETLFQVYSNFGRQIDIFLPTRDFPDWFGHQIKGTCLGPKSKYFFNVSTICFDVPQNSENKFLGMILWMVSSGLPGADAVVENKTNGNTWFHHHYLANHEAPSWVSFIPKTQIAVKFGDKIEASVRGSQIMERFGVHLVYKIDTIENY